MFFVTAIQKILEKQYWIKILALNNAIKRYSNAELIITSVYIKVMLKMINKKKYSELTDKIHFLNMNI